MTPPTPAGERAQTPMERHAALGPIAWADGGMRATTSDGFRVEIIGPLSRGCDLRWVAWIFTPPSYEGCAKVHLPCASATEARAEVGIQVTALRHEEAQIQARNPSRAVDA